MGYKLYRGHVLLRKREKPDRHHLWGMSCSEFKTALRRRGFRIPRHFFRAGCIARKGGRLYRFRWWSEDPVVDVSCQREFFDRWANSVEKIMTIGDVLNS